MLAASLIRAYCVLADPAYIKKGGMGGLDGSRRDRFWCLQGLTGKLASELPEGWAELDELSFSEQA
jgi:hypothetical protein